VREQVALLRWRSRAGWVAAGLCLALALAGWWPRLVAQFPLDSASRAGQLSAELSRERMLASGDGRVGRWPWSIAVANRGASGDVVWDGASQRGYLRFEGLEPNDPARLRYQLWIQDATRDARYPVDGGVFDVPRTPGAVVVPIHAAVPVREPVAFVVTLEEAGGAVVSSRERVVAAARPGR
jgi:hypothetical protein